MAEYFNTTDAPIDLDGGFVINPGETRAIPGYVLKHPYTKLRLRLGHLVAPVEVIVATPTEELSTDPDLDAVEEEIVEEAAAKSKKTSSKK